MVPTRCGGYMPRGGERSAPTGPDGFYRPELSVKAVAIRPKAGGNNAGPAGALRCGDG